MWHDFKNELGSIGKYKALINRMNEMEDFVKYEEVITKGEFIEEYKDIPDDTPLYVFECFERVYTPIASKYIGEDDEERTKDDVDCPTSKPYISIW